MAKPQKPDDGSAKIVIELKKMHKLYGFSVLRRACNRYLNAVREKENLEFDIEEAEEKLNNLKKKLEVN